ncbi:MAG: phosphoglucosamine mutase [Mycoplasmatales bacterium]
MGKYFGTDGIRGRFGSKLTIELSYQIGLSIGTTFKDAKVCIGKDPRESSDLIEDALVKGLVETGVCVETIGVVSTPIVSYAIINNDYDLGIMISASHNPYYDNGIKFFGSDGQKLSEALEHKVEEAIDAKQYTYCEGCVCEKSFILDYSNYLIKQSNSLEGLKIAIDCSNGSASNIAPSIFESLNAEVLVIANQPDGKNINDGVGSTHPEALIAFIKENDVDFGFAYDGDADRVLLFDKEGNELDGDYILYILAQAIELNNDVVISTVMANLGLVNIFESMNIKLIQADVGDKYVMREIKNHQASLGGEQSGHIILPDLLPTGDGILASLILASTITEADSLDSMIKDFLKYPQVLLNKHVENKVLAMQDQNLLSEIKKVEEELGSNGRVLVRTSGTEEIVRVMVEAKTQEDCDKYASYLIEFVK